MGKSPGNDTRGAPAPQGPPIEQLQPAQPPPDYPEFLPNQANAPPPTGLTQQMLDAIAANAAPPPMAAASAAAPEEEQRNTLATLIAALMDPLTRTRPDFMQRSGGGGANRAGYTTSGVGGTSGFGGRSSSATGGSGWGGGVGGGMGGRSSGGLY